MFEALLPLLLGFHSVAMPTSTAEAVLQSLVITPPSAVELTYVPASASGMVIIDANNGQVVFGKNADTKRPMASITKLMTALLIAENHNPKELVTIPPEATAAGGQMAYLKVGETYTVADLLSALLIMSANDAAVALAMYDSGTVPQFVAKMNARAQILGLHNTSYANPTGLDNPRQYSTPKDIAWLTQYVVQQPMLLTRMKRITDTIVSTQGSSIELQHTHEFMHKLPSLLVSTRWHVSGGKTGTTSAAKECVVSLIEGNNTKYIVVILHSDQRYRDLANVLTLLPNPPISTLQAAL